MNIVIGAASLAGPGSRETLACTIRGLLGEGMDLTQLGDKFVCGTLRDGVIVGTARTSSKILSFIGTISGPLPNSEIDNPLDTPDLVAAYLIARHAELGVRFLDQIQGSYGLALFDLTSGTLLLAADPAAGRTIFFHESSDRLLFSSNLYSLARTLGPRLQIDRSLEDFFLIHGFYPFGHTPYKGVLALQPGKILKWKDGRITEHKIRFNSPWNDKFNAADITGATESTAINVLYDAFMQSLQEQCSSDPQAAVLLGGFDSALVASALKRLGKDVSTYTFKYKDASYNQPHTDTLRDYLGTHHVDVTITRDVIERGLQTFPQIFNQPTCWPNYVIQTDLACSAIRQDGIRFVYSGDGCDAAFLGYPGTYRRAVAFNALPPIAPATLKVFLALSSWKGLDFLFGHPYRVALNLLRALGREQPARGYLTFRVMDELTLSQLRIDPAPPQQKPYDDLLRILSEPFRDMPSLRLAYQGKSAVSPNRNKIVGSSDHTGVAILSPYMHAGLKAFATALPENLMRPDERTASHTTGKYILMKMAETKKLLPESIIHQPKMAAVDAPIDTWYAGPTRPLLHEIFKTLPFRYNTNFADRLMDEKLSERMFQRLLLSDKVISHAVSLLATYATFSAVASGNSSAHH